MYPKLNNTQLGGSEFGKKYTRLSNMIEDVVPKLHDIIEAYGYSLMHGGGSITYILPNKDVLKQLESAVNKAEKGGVDDHHLVIDMLHSLAIDDALLPEKFLAGMYNGHIANRAQRILNNGEASYDPKSRVLTLKPKAVAKPVMLELTYFSPINTHVLREHREPNNIVVYRMSEKSAPMPFGEHGVEGSIARKHMEKGKGKRGGFEYAEMARHSHQLAARSRIAEVAEKVFRKHLADAKSVPVNHVYLNSMDSLLRFLKVNHPELLARVGCFIDIDPIASFYILLQPYRRSHDDGYIIPDGVVQQWLDAKSIRIGNESARWAGLVAEMRACCGKEAKQEGVEVAAVEGAAEEAREELSHGTATKATFYHAYCEAFNGKIRDEYIECIGGDKSGLVDDLCDVKLMQDFFRYYMHNLVKAYSQNQGDLSPFWDMLDVVKSIFSFNGVPSIIPGAPGNKVGTTNEFYWKTVADFMASSGNECLFVPSADAQKDLAPLYQVSEGRLAGYPGFESDVRSDADKQALKAQLEALLKELQ